MSNEIDTVDQNTKGKKNASSESSESNDSDYIDEGANNRYKVGVVVSPLVKALDLNAVKKDPEAANEIDTN